MEVSVEETGALARRLTIVVPADQIEGQVAGRIQTLARTARMDGFRPGKVPLNVVEQKFGAKIRAEVSEQLLRAMLDKVLAEHQLNPAGEPRISPGIAVGEAGVRYTVEFEIVPMIDPAPLNGARLIKPVAGIMDSDVDDMLMKLRYQRGVWEASPKPAARGDRMIVDYTATVEGQAVPGQQGSSVSIELGAGSLFPTTVEDQLLGVADGEERRVEVVLPDDFSEAKFAGKRAEYYVVAKKVTSLTLPELTDEFARQLGVDSLASLRIEVRKNLERERDRMVRSALKEQVFNLLLQLNPVEVPTGMIEEESRKLAIAEGRADQITPAISEQARQRIALGLIVGEIVKRTDLMVDEARVRTLIEEIASTYERPDDVVQWYYQNPDMYSSARAVVLEEQVVEWAVEQAQVDEKTYTFSEFVEARQAGRI